jgi:hypothetical protein
MRYFRVIVRPDPQEIGAAQGYIEAEDEAAARVKLPKLDGLRLFDHSDRMHKVGIDESWRHGRHIIERRARLRRRDCPARRAIEG